MRKKGIQLNQAFGAVLTLVLVAILIIVAIYLVASLQTSMRTPNTSGSAVNESVAIPTTAGVTLASASRVDGSCGAITSALNGTTDGNVAIGLGNFTQTGCTLVNTTDLSSYTSTIRISYPYTYSADTSASNASGTIITQFATYPALIGLVGTIIFLALVIGVLVASFAFGGKRGA
jgi:hypothetical protein